MKGEGQMEMQAEKYSNLAQNENLSQDQAENKTTEIVTAEFDTLDSKPLLKKLRIERTVSDKAIHADRQMVSRVTGTEVKGERYKAKGERETESHTVKKSKPAPSSAFWWIAGGATIVLLLLFWVRRKVIYP